VGARFLPNILNGTGGFIKEAFQKRQDRKTAIELEKIKSDLRIQEYHVGLALAQETTKQQEMTLSFKDKEIELELLKEKTKIELANIDFQKTRQDTIKNLSKGLVYIDINNEKYFEINKKIADSNIRCQNVRPYMTYFTLSAYLAMSIFYIFVAWRGGFAYQVLKDATMLATFGEAALFTLGFWFADRTENNLKKTI
jgi:hypothetical protein